MPTFFTRTARNLGPKFRPGLGVRGTRFPRTKLGKPGIAPGGLGFGGFIMRGMIRDEFGNASTNTGQNCYLYEVSTRQLVATYKVPTGGPPEYIFHCPTNGLYFAVIDSGSSRAGMTGYVQPT